MTIDELQKLWDDWEANHEPGDLDSGDDYYWRGASSFFDYIKEHLRSDKG